MTRRWWRAEPDASYSELVKIKRRKGGVEETLRVMCGGKQHKITVRQFGRITLHNHNCKAEKVAEGLGQERVRCLLILDEWRASQKSRWRTPKLHKNLRTLFQLCVGWSSRRKEFRGTFVDRLEIKFVDRLKHRVSEHTDELYERLDRIIRKKS